MPQPDSSRERLRPVASRQNALVKQLRHAFTQAAPAPDGSIAVEGLKLVEEAIRSGRRLRAVFFAQSALQRAGRLMPQLSRTTETILLPDDVFHSAVPSEAPQGIAALVHPLAATLEDLFGRAPAAGSAASPAGGPELAPSQLRDAEPETPRLPSNGRRQSALILGCAGLQDPGNLGTILRSAEAFGATGVLTTEGTVSAANPKVARASAGSIFRLPLVHLSTEDAIAALRAHNVRIAVTSSHHGIPAHQADLTQPTAIFIGNEGHGLPRPLLDAADFALAIPHSPKVESLNAAIAASLLLYEAHRQRNS